jgi:hypothetical protein
MLPGVTSPVVRIGGRTTTVQQAEGWVRSYFNEANRMAQEPFAYPAYDEMVTGSGPDHLNDGDLLAPTLLNAAPSIAAFYSLQSVRSRLEQGLRAVPPDLTLEAAALDGSMEERLTGLFGVLDSDGLRGVRLTKLSKVLHRKRPRFIPLYDTFVRACYVGPEPGFPMQLDATRTWSAFTCELGYSIARDITNQSAVWQRLVALAPEVSTLRVLDVVAWRLGRTVTS